MKKHLPLLLLVLLNLIVGLFALPGFGESVDELSQNSYAERTLRAVGTLITGGTWNAYFFEEEAKQGSHGPAFMMVVTLLRNLIAPEANPIEKLLFNHFLYFLAFQIGIVSLYFLARRWMSEIAALGTALLFNTQPLLLGHAFMNPKDTVFMSFLIASAALGMRMIDRNQGSPGKDGKPLSGGIRSFLRELRQADVWLAGLALGFTSAIRIAAPLVGLVLLAHLVLTRRWQAVPRFVAYGLISVLFMIAFWPYLWPDPFGRLIGSILHSANYPDTHLTLFKGVLYDAPDIPRSYLPTLLPLQLTEPVLLLLLGGGFLLFKERRRGLAALALIWFVLPALGIIGLRLNLYNNFRQVFFILPPLFLIAGLGLDWLFSRISLPVARYLVLLLILLPGLYSNVTLYPYQYVYYNQAIGGIGGAYRLYELDYWRLAFREAQIYLNQTASPGANTFVGNSKPSAQTFARPDLLFNAFGARKRNWEKYDYIIVTTSGNDDEMFAEYPTVFTVDRDGVPLVYVKKIR